VRRIVSVAGTRPNFMKTAPVARALARRPDRFAHLLVHTGRHYDRAMSEVFFEQLEVAEPDLVHVPGDVNSTPAAALTGSSPTPPMRSPTSPQWDGRAAGRIADVLDGLDDYRGSWGPAGGS
jgi:UDP-N-acetylglucosamine 2-epimerase